MKAKADFELYIRNIKINEGFKTYVIIIDEDLGNISVTNDMENILAEIHSILPTLNEATIIYKDSCGNFDGVRFKGDSFAFYPISTKTESEALELIKFFEYDYGKI